MEIMKDVNITVIAHLILMVTSHHIQKVMMTN